MPTRCQTITLIHEIASVLDLKWVYAELAPHYPRMVPYPVDPVLMLRMLLIGATSLQSAQSGRCAGRVRVNLAYRWFCGLSIRDRIPDHSAFCRARNERFRGGQPAFRRVFEQVVEDYGGAVAGLVGKQGFAVDASLIAADANKQRSVAGLDWHKDRDRDGEVDAHKGPGVLRLRRQSISSM